MNILSRAHKASQKERPAMPEGRFLTLWQSSPNLIHCCVESGGCRYSKEMGACIMCDYGIGRRLTPRELAGALREELAPRVEGLRTILFGAYGSVLDPEEVPDDCFSEILRFLQEHQVPQVIFETHCATVTEEKLSQIRQALPRRQIVIEMGYESCDPYILRHCLNKVLDLPVLERAMERVHSFDMRVCLNVFLGTPFLTAADQLSSAADAVRWAVDRGADSLVVFPANVKPFTLLYDLYRSGDYQVLSHWMLPALFRTLPDEALGRIALSWYGERRSIYQNDEHPPIPPRCCEVCGKVLRSFYHDFLQEPAGSRRRALTEELWSRPLDCSCREELIRSLEVKRPRLSVAEIEKIVTECQHHE